MEKTSICSLNYNKIDVKKNIKNTLNVLQDLLIHMLDLLNKLKIQKTISKNLYKLWLKLTSILK